jgi:hypothetical protein
MVEIIAWALREPKNKGTKEQRNKGTKERKNEGNKGTKERRNKGTKELDQIHVRILHGHAECSEASCLF